MTNPRARYNRCDACGRWCKWADLGMREYGHMDIAGNVDVETTMECERCR